MGRKPVIKPAIFIALGESENPLRFSELKKKIIQILNRKRLDDKQLHYNLTQLMDDGVVEKVLFNEKITYKLTTSYYEQQLKSTLLKLLSDMKVSQLHDSLDDDELPPHMVFLNPPAYDYKKNRPIDQLNRVEMSLSFGGGPMEVAGESRIIPSWNDPSGAISSIMLNDFYGLLSKREKSNTIKLIRWAYWAGVRERIEDNTSFNLAESIKENKKFALNCIKKFKNDHRRIEAEKTLLKILQITEKLFNINNLAELMSYINDKKDEHRHLLNKIIFSEGVMAGGERLFLKFMEFGRMVSSGLYLAGILDGDSPYHQIDYRERFLFSSSKVWDDFFIHLIQDPFYYPEYSTPELEEIRGNLEESLDKVRKLKNYLKNILELPFKRKIAIIYLWGFPETFYLSNRGIIRTFAEWREALKNGRLYHRIWIFEEKTLKRLRKAYNAVWRNTEPLPVRIDKEPWTLKDLYNFHPFGKDPAFWDDIIRDIEICSLRRDEVWESEPVLGGVYQAAINKEKEVLEKILDEEEELAKRKRRRR